MSEGMKPDGPDDHPLMALLYDIENTWGDADDFFLALVNRRPGSRVLDVGCGTGMVTIAVAQAGHAVTGVEPNRSFIELARSKPGGELVRWVHGTSAQIPEEDFDVALMTGHVAQAFLDDGEWHGVLTDLKHALVPGGTLAFDSLDPATRAWERWSGGSSSTFPDGSAFDSKAEIVAVAGDIVTFEVDTHLRGGERRHGVSDYRFRSHELLRASVEQAGFHIEATYGGWHGQPVGDGVGEIVVIATA